MELERWTCHGIYFGRYQDYAEHRAVHHPPSPARRQELQSIVDQYLARIRGAS